MRLSVGSAFVGLILIGAQAHAQNVSNYIGTWQTEDGRAKIRIENCKETSADLCGYVVWLRDPLTDDGKPRTDVKNPDPAKRTRPSLGMELMTNLKLDDDKHYAGEIYNADNGKKYDITLKAEKASELEVKGCMLKYLCGSQSWARVADLPVPGSNKMVQTKQVHPVPATH